MINEEDKKLIGACGIYCANCGIYQSYKSQNRQRQEKIAKDIFGENTDVKPEQITCDGCKGAIDVHWSGECKIMLCNRKKELLACSECAEFPCKTVEEFWAKNENAKKNAFKQREIGLEKWLEKQKGE
ncbi:MAG: DUF3795 domain-containing protein [Candidatus Bathyarchaeota archaeon]|nr:MAG: DUF3795 domain-containing protein [Candidatus Bathyarchaeota archaeon]